MKNLYNYTIVIEQDDPAGWHAYCPDLPGVHSFGDTKDEAKENMAEAMYAYLEEKRTRRAALPARRQFVESLTLVFLRNAKTEDCFWEKLIAFLETQGFVETRQVGSHKVLVRKEMTVVVPLHGGKDLGRGLISSILREAEIEREVYEKNV